LVARASRPWGRERFKGEEKLTVPPVNIGKMPMPRFR